MTSLNVFPLVRNPYIEFYRSELIAGQNTRFIAPDRCLMMAITDSTTTQDSQNEQRQQKEDRARRAREEEMDVALLRQGGLYEIDSASGNTYEVDLLDATCTCPDHQNSDTPNPCKHIQRVQLELDSGQIPRPDGRLPETAFSTHPSGDEIGAHLVATLKTRIREREERIGTLEAEIQALQFVCEVADAVGDGGEFDLKQILADEHGPASQL